MILKPIGRVRSGWHQQEGTPIQPNVSRGRARVEIDPPYRKALEDLVGFDRIWVITWLDRARGFESRVVPYRDKEPRGLFATRAPARPNPIGLSCVIISAVDPHSGIIQTGPTDILDGTPVVDIKPYVPWFDAFSDARSGWFDNARDLREEADDRFDA